MFSVCFKIGPKANNISAVASTARRAKRMRFNDLLQLYFAVYNRKA